MLQYCTLDRVQITRSEIVRKMIMNEVRFQSDIYVESKTGHTQLGVWPAALARLV